MILRYATIEIISQELVVFQKMGKHSSDPFKAPLCLKHSGQDVDC